MKCNIDSRGRKLRAIGGIWCCVLGAAALTLAFVTSWPFWLLVGLGVGLAIGGVFQLFESRRGWCALRAMGVKTPF